MHVLCKSENLNEGYDLGNKRKWKDNINTSFKGMYCGIVTGFMPFGIAASVGFL
jgi:hypothetical protein